MGQYYTPVITPVQNLQSIETLYSHAYGSGLKLMEHSYIGNSFVNAVMSQIVEKPRRIAWVGDYSNQKYGQPYEDQVERIMTWKKFLAIYKIAMNDKKYRIHPEPLEHYIESIEPRYLVNHSKGVFIDMVYYIAKNKCTEPYGTYCVHPLPLLTACGNDRGGGDYHDCFPDADKVGTWAFDIISVEGADWRGLYSEVTFDFTEQRKADEQ